MQNLISLTFKAFRAIFRKIQYIINLYQTKWLLYVNKVIIGEGLLSFGVPFISIARNGKCAIGNNFQMNNITSSNPIGRIQACILAVDNNGVLKIGNNVGMSFTAINCQKEIVIEDNVIIGGGTCIYDSDYHPLNASDRLSNLPEKIMTAPVLIRNNVFIGTNSTILKGVTIGENSIVGACSVVTKNIPSNEIWGGNPARYIKNV